MVRSKTFGKIKVSSVFLILLSILFIYSTSTFLRLNYSFYLAVIMYIVFWGLTYRCGYRWRAISSKLSIWFFLSLCTIPLFIMNDVSRVWVVYLSGYIHIYFWTAAFAFVADNYTLGAIKKYLVIHLIILLVGVIATLRALALYPLAARAMYGYAEGLQDTNYLFKIGCGGFGFVYSFVFLGIGFTAVLLQKRNVSINRWFMVGYAIIALYMVLYSGFSTAILLTITAIVCCIVYARNNSIWGLVGFLLAIVCILLFSEEIVFSLYSVSESLGIDIVADKMNGVLLALKSNTILELRRFQVYGISVAGFLANPIWGVGYAGTDSQILDLFSYIGIWGVVYIGLLHSAFSIVRKYVNKRYVNIVELIALMLATLNPFSDMTLMSIVFMFTPTILFIVQPNKHSVQERL